MISDQQREALSILAEVWALSSDVRLGQLFAHLGFLGEVHLGRSLGYIDDDELMSILYRHRAELLARLKVPPSQAMSAAGGTEAAMPVSEGSKSLESAPAAEP
jgi:hypothetical protein